MGFKLSFIYYFKIVIEYLLNIYVLGVMVQDIEVKVGFQRIEGFFLREDEQL